MATTSSHAVALDCASVWTAHRPGRPATSNAERGAREWLNLAKAEGNSNFIGSYATNLMYLANYKQSYYGPFKEMTDYGPLFCDVRDQEARKQHRAISCPDKILTAFCQLGALRLSARRALIFFFDVNHAYIMAEATQTLSLEDGSHDPGDQLWSE